MREIKFRGKRVDGSNEWAYGHYVFMGVFGDKPVHRIIWHDEGGAEHNVIIDPATLGQYTGLTDKAGREVFEGDILERDVHTSYRGNRFAVKWNTDSARFNIKSTSPILKTLQIIGNTIDNPELLGGGV